MEKVRCEISKVQYKKYKPGRYDSTSATCSKCGNKTSCNGSGENSVRSCLGQLRSTCPRGEINFYLASDVSESLVYRGRTQFWSRTVTAGYSSYKEAAEQAKILSRERGILVTVTRGDNSQYFLKDGSLDPIESETETREYGDQFPPTRDKLFCPPNAPTINPVENTSQTSTPPIGIDLGEACRLIEWMLFALNELGSMKYRYGSGSFTSYARTEAGGYRGYLEQLQGFIGDDIVERAFAKADMQLKWLYLQERRESVEIAIRIAIKALDKAKERISFMNENNIQSHCGRKWSADTGSKGDYTLYLWQSTTYGFRLEREKTQRGL